MTNGVRLPLRDREILPATLAVFIVSRLAESVNALHESGSIHRAITIAALEYDAQGQPGLSGPPNVCWVGRSPVTAEWLPPELHSAIPFELPVDLPSAKATFKSLGLTLDPRQVDIYQLGALLCRLVSGEPANAYLRSLKIKRLVDPVLRQVVERALGCDGQPRFRDLGEFVAALKLASEQLTVEAVTLADAVDDSDPPRKKPDTTPSMVSAGDRDADTAIEPTHPPSPHSLKGQESGNQLPFQKLGHYEIVSRIGQGGMGDVYLGYDRSLDRSVAIKVLPVEFARQDDFIRRFRAEATSAAKLIHPNVVQIYFIGESSGHHYFAMQYVKGESLAELLKQQPRLDPDQALSIIEQVLSGLAAAHQQGLVHRDIKPANVLLDQTHQRAWLADFGLVKSLQAESAGKTATGVIMGTADYMPPEQARGRHVDHRADLYSMGVLMYQMLSGRLPFEADSPTALIFQHVYEQPPPLSQFATDISPQLTNIVETLMQKSPDERYQSAEEALMQLRALRAGHAPMPVPSRKESRAAESTRSVRRNRVESDVQSDDKPLPGAIDPDSIGWWQRARDRAASLISRHSPEALKNLQNTQQQVGGAITEYERRERKLKALANEAKSVLAALKTQAESHRAAGAANDSGDRVADELDARVQEQEDQFENIRLNLAKVRAKVQQLNSQRNLLNARLKTANASAHIAGHRVRTSTYRNKVFLTIGVVFVFCGFAFPMLWWLKSRVSSPPAANLALKNSSNNADATVSVTALAPFSIDEARLMAEDCGRRIGLPVEFTNSIGMKFRLIPPGKFRMGGTQDEINAVIESLDRSDPNYNHIVVSMRSELPQHEVLLTHPFYMSVNEVTQQQYSMVVGLNPSFYARTGPDPSRAELVANRDTSNHPVENVSWTDAVEFSKKLSQSEGMMPFPAIGIHAGTGYRLPTEAEWEFACRAGTETSFWFGPTGSDASRFGWSVENSSNQTHEVGQFPPNPFGLCDTCGNVWEWCQDYWDVSRYTRQSQGLALNPLTQSTGDPQHMLRGGSFVYQAQRCRSSHRTMIPESAKDWNIGFRVVLSIDGALAATKKINAPSTGRSPDRNTPPIDPNVLSELSSRSNRVLTVKSTGEPVDILKQIDLVRDVHSGNWERKGSSLIGHEQGRLYLPVKPPEDYQLKFHLKRIEKNDTLIVGFIMSGRLGMIGIDVNNSEHTGLYVDGVEPYFNGTRINGQVLPIGANLQVEFTVHPGHLHVAVNGKQLLDWHGASERLFFFPEHAMPNRETPFLTVANAKYQFDAIEIVPIEPEAVPARIAKLEGQIELIPLFDLNRDANRPGWRMNQNALQSPDSEISRLLIPLDVPEEYTLSAMVERPIEAGGDQTLTFGILAGESLCQIVAANSEGPGLDVIDGRRWNVNETSLRGLRLTSGVPTQMSITVRKNEIRLEIDRRTVIDWRGDFARLSTSPEWASPDGKKLYLGTTGQFRFRDVKLGPPADPPTLPVHTPFVVGRPLNLLSLIDPVRDAFAGTWKKDDKSLRMMGDVDSSKLVIPCNVPEEYQFTMVLAREPGGRLENESLTLQLPMGPVMADLLVDSFTSTTTGIHLDGRDLSHASFAASVVAIPPGTLQAIVCTVRRTGLKVATADRTIFEWTGNPERYTTSHFRATPASKIAIGSWNSRFRIDRLELEPLPPSAFARVDKSNLVGRLLPTIQVQRDSRLGDWKRESEGIVSPKVPAARLRIPVAPPERYVLSANVERKSGVDQLSIGLVVGGHPCSVEIDGTGAGGGGGFSSGLDRIDGRLFSDDANLTRQLYAWPLTPKGKSVLVRCVVLPDTVVVMCDDKEVVRWHGDPRRFSQGNSFLPPNSSEADRSQLWIGARDSEILVRDLDLQTIGEDVAERIEAGFSGPFPTRLPIRTPSADPLFSSQNLGLKVTEELAVLSAKYGTDEKSVDLTERLNEVAKTGSLRFVVDDSLTTPPQGATFNADRNPGFLRLRYRLNGSVFQRKFAGNEVVELDSRWSPSKTTDDKFEVIEARCGSGIYGTSEWSEVTDTVRPFVKLDSLQLTDEQLRDVLSAKPGGKESTASTALFVRYRDSGGERSTVIPRGARAMLGKVPREPGLVMVAYSGSNFDDERFARIDPNIDVDYGQGSPGPGIPSDNFSIRWQGTLSVPAAGTYTFSCRHDDGATIWLDDQLRYVVWGQAAYSHFDVTLEKKDYEITVQYCDRQVVGNIRLEWKSNLIPNQTIPASAFSHDPKLAIRLGAK